MPFVAGKIVLSEDSREVLKTIANSRTLPMNQIERAQIILLASEGKNNQEILKQVGLSEDAVSKWRNRWIKSAQYMEEVERSKPKELTQEITKFLKDRPRPGCPCDFTEEQILKILEVACRNPADYNKELGHWTLPQLADAVVKEGIVETISPASIRRFLKYR